MNTMRLFLLAMSLLLAGGCTQPQVSAAPNPVASHPETPGDCGTPPDELTADYAACTGTLLPPPGISGTITQDSTDDDVTIWAIPAGDFPSVDNPERLALGAVIPDSVVEVAVLATPTGGQWHIDTDEETVVCIGPAGTSSPVLLACPTMITSEGILPVVVQPPATVQLVDGDNGVEINGTDLPVRVPGAPPSGPIFTVPDGTDVAPPNPDAYLTPESRLDAYRDSILNG